MNGMGDKSVERGVGLHGPTRRGFVVGLAGATAMMACLGGAATALASGPSAPDARSASTDALTSHGDTSHIEADLVVVGAGCAGLSAAVAAVDAGATSVVILERTGRTGGSLALTNGSMAAACTRVQKADGIDDTIDAFVDDIMRIGSMYGGKPNEELVRVYCEEDTAAFEWLWDHGLADYEFRKTPDGKIVQLAPEHELYSVPRTCYIQQCKDPSSFVSAPHEILDSYVRALPEVTIRFNTRATELVPNNLGQVTSVVAVDADGATTSYTGTHGVVVCTGGYGANPTILGMYAPNGDSYLTGCGSWSDGNGLQLMQKVGGTLTHMDYIPHGAVGLENLESPGHGQIAPTYTFRAGGICVNRDGKRFMNENVSPTVHEEATSEQPGAMRFDVFTDKIADDLRAAGNAALLDMYYTSETSIAYRSMKQADTIEGLAREMGVPEEAFKKTVDDYNAAVVAGGTDEFGRSYDDGTDTYKFCTNKIEGDRFYAVPLHNLVVMTLGGIACDARLNVVDGEGTPIPGLYAAGEVVGGVWGRQPSSACGTMGSVTFGRLTGHGAMTDGMDEGYEVKPAAEIFDDAVFEKRARPDQDASALGTLADGEYTACVDGQEGPLEVKVTVSDGRLAACEVVRSAETANVGEPALPELVSQVVAAGGPDIDGVAGATLTSNRVSAAVRQCLEQAAR